ncbi:MAG: ABC transporter permease, partial [Candidatus Paraprevotella stercoravium]|nr:ABC transporter permease [Candidatus Paraprevotella stercoravium]
MMILHYLKSAVRSLMKYKVQTTASMVGLALGFVCFALSAVWVRYEQTFDSFHRGADRMYLLGSSSAWENQTNLKHRFPLAEELKETFPEVEDAAAYWYWEIPVKLSEDAAEDVNLGCVRADSLFVRMFDVRLVRGSWSFLNVPEEVALTEEGARRLFGTTDVLGRAIYYAGNTYRISAVLTGWGQHTNFPFSIMFGMDQTEKNKSSYPDYYISLRLRSEADTAALMAQMNNSSLKY